MMRAKIIQAAEALVCAMMRVLATAYNWLRDFESKLWWTRFALVFNPIRNESSR